MTDGTPAEGRASPSGSVCANCDREPREDENPDDEWRVYSEGTGELVMFCPECAEREFGVADDPT